MLYLYFLLYSVHLIIYMGTVNRWAVYAHRWACLLVLVGDSFRRWAVCAHRWRVSWCWLVIASGGGRCMLIGGRASWCWLVIASGGGRCVLIGGASPGAGW